ncbi:UDP-N-acetylmuramate dehydrogenase [Treponema parvum]|uniref:UDP-N-acetylmuramate dehydrogenase n=1 Tax=Treponema parvum TaxID=138851 RepID=UPI001AEC6AFD|nr:UDP-N-acetylmuramate dehydrogenase [Treponema parvum]QTQ16805.1 UDP-N-acetylmuramate dehydrogenase [Treponema parvum]
MYNLREIAEKCNTDKIFKGRILFDEKIAPRTSFKIGGAAPVLFEPSDTDSLLYILSLLKKNSAPYFVLGGGTNLVVSDQGFDAAVIATCALNGVKIEESCFQNSRSPQNLQDAQRSKDDFVSVTAFAGTPVKCIVDFCTENALSGFEPFAGLPGSIGGAVYMNAACFGISISDVFISAEYIEDFAGADPAAGEYGFDKSDWEYKKSPFTDTSRIITSVSLRLTKKTQEESKCIKEKCAAFVRERVKKGHFKYPSAGSVFKNDRAVGIPSGKIIEEAGLKGFSIGGAQISPWHGNIIINKNKATQADVKALVDYVKAKIFEEKGIKLETEVIFCGK